MTPNQCILIPQTERADSSGFTSNGEVSDGKNHQVDEIIGCTERQGQLVFLMKWLNEPDPQVVPAAICECEIPTDELIPDA